MLLIRDSIKKVIVCAFINYCVEKMKCKLLMSRVSYSNIRKLIPNNYSEKKKFEQNPIRNNTSSIEVLPV